MSIRTFLVLLLTLGRFVYAGAVAIESEVDEQLRILQSDPDLSTRLDAAARLAAEIGRPTSDQIRRISEVLRAAREPEVRCSVAGIFAAIGRQSRFHLRVRNAPTDEGPLLGALRESLIYERDASVRACLVRAACEFDSEEAQVVIDRAKSDSEATVRDAALSAERKRNERLRSL